MKIDFNENSKVPNIAKKKPINRFLLAKPDKLVVFIFKIDIYHGVEMRVEKTFTFHFRSELLRLNLRKQYVTGKWIQSCTVA